MIIKTHVLTTTNKQGLSKTQADNARANINAQAQLTTDADSHIKLTPSENGVKIAIDGEIGKTYTSADEDYVKVNNLDDTIDLATDAKNALSDVSKKVDKVDGKDLSSNDFTDECLEKLDSIATGAQVNVQPNWNETDETSDAYIQNKPEIYTAKEIDELLDAHAVFLKSTDDLPITGDSSKVYYVGPKTTASGDQYDVYVWNTKEKKYIVVDESTISLEGYWHDTPVYDGTGNAITSVTVGKTGLVTFNKESTFALDSDVKTHTDDSDIHITSDEREKWNGYKPNNGRLTFTVNGNELPQVFTANSSENVEIPLTDTTYGEVTTETSGLMSVSDKKKLDGIAEGAEVNVQSDWNEADTTSDAYIKNKPSMPNPANDGKLTFTVNGVKLATEFSADSASNVEIALTDTTYEPATDQKNGLLSSADKKKLDGVEEGAESNVQSDWNDADTTSDAYIKNKPSIPNPANDGKLTFTVNGKKLEQEFSADSASNVEIALTDTKYGNATDETAGLMSSEDKKKLDGIAEGAEVNVQVDWNEADATSDAYIKNKPSIPNPANDGKLTFTVNGEKLEQEFSADSASNVEIALTDTTYDNATDETAGLMSSADKKKLDGIAAGAEVNVQSDWKDDDTTSNAYIKNKPSIPNPANDGKLTFTVNGEKLETEFSADSASNVEIALTDTTYDNATDETAGLMSAADKKKLDGIADGAEVNVQADWNESDTTSDAFIKGKPDIPAAANNGILSFKVNGESLTKTFGADSSENVEIELIDTQYQVATDKADGLMSAEDKKKLDGIDDGAEVNVQADWTETDETSDAFIKGKPNIPAAAKDGKLTFTVNGKKLENEFSANSASNVEIALTDTTYDNATETAAGLMSSEDKKKLDGIESGANANVQPDWTESDTTSDAFIKGKPDIPAAANNGTLSFKVNGESLSKTFGADSSENVEIELTDTQYQVATDKADGLMSAEDKVKLDGIAEGAGVNVQADWTETDETSDAFIKGKPNIPAAAKDGKLTFTINGKKLEQEFSADSASNVEIALTDTTYDNATETAAGLMSAEDKVKLDGIADGAEVNVQADWTEIDETSDAFINHKPDIPAAAKDGKLTFTINGKKLEQEFSADSASNVEIALTDTTYDNATDDTAGLMSAADKVKLDGIAEGAEVNVQADWNETDTTSNAFINHKPDIPAAANNGILSFKVNGESLPNTFGADSSENVEIELTDTQYQAATDKADGLMSTADKVKLDGIESGAKVNVQADWNETDETSDAFINHKPDIPSAANNGILSFKVNGESLTKTFGADSSENVEIELTDTQYQAATDKADGLMSAADKVKLDGIDEFAGSVAGLVPDASDAAEGSFLDHAGNWSVPAVYTDGVSVTGNGTANSKIAMADGYIVGTESQIDVSVNEAKTNLVVSPIIADAIEVGNESLVTSSMVAGAIGTNLSVAAGDGVNLTQDTEDAPLVISVQYPIVIEQNPSEFVPIDDGKLHFLVMQ